MFSRRPQWVFCYGHRTAPGCPVRAGGGPLFTVGLLASHPPIGLEMRPNRNCKKRSTSPQRGIRASPQPRPLEMPKGAAAQLRKERGWKRDFSARSSHCLKHEALVAIACPAPQSTPAPSWDQLAVLQKAPRRTETPLRAAYQGTWIRSLEDWDTYDLWSRTDVKNLTKYNWRRGRLSLGAGSDGPFLVVDVEACRCLQ